MTLTVNTLFSGIGATEKALKRLGIPFEVVGISEIDKYAIKSYEVINGPTRNYGDICKINRLDYADLWTYSFPCQDLSTAGKQAGISEGTRSGLLLEVERLLTNSVIEGNQPKYLLLENVKNLVGKKFKPDFDRWLQKLEQLGYRNYWQILNAKDYNIPQNRERVFVVSIRNDIDKDYKFPAKVPLTLKLKDVLESNVSAKYYLSDEQVARFVTQLNDKMDKQNISYCIDANYWKGTTLKNFLEKNRRQLVKVNNQGMNAVIKPIICASCSRNPENPSDRTVGSPTEQRLEFKTDGCTNIITTVQKDNSLIHQVSNIVDTGNFNNPQRGRIYSPIGISPALNCCGGGGLEPKILIKNATKQGYLEAKDDDFINLQFPDSQTRRGRVQQEISATLQCNDSNGVMDSFRIRKLTPMECWRLMDFDDEDFILAQMAGISNSQLYKQAGNSICVGVLVDIFRELFND